MLFTFQVFQDATKHWRWQVTREVGPAVFVVAKSGHSYTTAEGAKQEFYAMCQNFQSSTTPPPAS